MDYLNSMLPEVKFASCLDDLLTFRRLVAYKLKVSCIKANKLFRAYVLFSRFDEQENSDVSASEPVLSGVNDETWGYGNLLMPPCLSDPKSNPTVPFSDEVPPPTLRCFLRPCLSAFVTTLPVLVRGI